MYMGTDLRDHYAALLIPKAICCPPPQVLKIFIGTERLQHPQAVIPERVVSLFYALFFLLKLPPSLYLSRH
jgi:hypothetical protein